MIYLGADHRGFELKEELKAWLNQKGEVYTDLGNTKLDPQDDFPDFAALVAKKVSQGQGKGIVICGSGGMALVANKFSGVRAVEVWNEKTAEHAKAHDDANVLMLPADFVTVEKAKKMVEIWLKTPVKSQEKYQRRLNKLKKIEEANYA